MIEINFELGGAALMRERIDVEFLSLAIIVNVLNDGIKIIGGIDAIGLTARLAPARAPNRGLDGIVRVDVLFDQIEFELRRDDWPPALGLVQFEDALQNVARGNV